MFPFFVSIRHKRRKELCNLIIKNLELEDEDIKQELGPSETNHKENDIVKQEEEDEDQQEINTGPEGCK